jgi:hypothetical protein
MCAAKRILLSCSCIQIPCDPVLIESITADQRTSNGLMFEQPETRTKTRKLNKEPRGPHAVAFSLCLVARAVARSVLP